MAMGKNKNEKKHARAEPHSGVITLTARGIGFVRAHSEDAEDLLIEKEHLNTALHGDLVEVVLLPRRKNDTRWRGEVLRVLERSKTTFVGTVYKEQNGCFVDVDSKKFYTTIRINEEESKNLASGLKVVVELLPWTNPKQAPRGRILEKLGPAGEHNTEMRAIVASAGFDYSFPAPVESRAGEIERNKDAIMKTAMETRKDMRDRTTFTIDPDDAKDFDDAISVRELDSGLMELGVHIADVSGYVEKNDPIDQEAAERGTSIYLVDRTIPMLPEVLSNDVCSLNPFEDKLAFSIVFTITKAGEVKDEWVGETIIKSDKRFTYHEAQRVLDTGSGAHSEELLVARDISRALRKKRYESGAINFDSQEVGFDLDQDGKPVRIYLKERLEVHLVIEDLMLLANRHVAALMAKCCKDLPDNQRVFVYRIHDSPKEERIDQLSTFLKALGYELKSRSGVVDSKDLNALLKQVKGTPEEDLINTATIRSMAKAVYSLKNIGHFGLSFTYYTHFTSPIRRYPDLMVHRLVKGYLKGEKIDPKEYSRYERLVTHSSEREAAAVEAERESTKLKQVEYMAEHIGETFSGVITGVTEWGIYVAEDATKAEGMVRLRDMQDDFYTLDEHGFQLVGERTGKTLRLGDRVTIKLVAADIEARTLDWHLA